MYHSPEILFENQPQQQNYTTPSAFPHPTSMPRYEPTMNQHNSFFRPTESPHTRVNASTPLTENFNYFINSIPTNLPLTEEMLERHHYMISSENGKQLREFDYYSMPPPRHAFETVDLNDTYSSVRDLKEEFTESMNTMRNSFNNEPYMEKAIMVESFVGFLAELRKKVSQIEIPIRFDSFTFPPKLGKRFASYKAPTRISKDSRSDSWLV
jgi:hypothetical protein